MTALARALRDLVCRPKVPTTVERNLLVAERAQAIAEQMKYCDPAMNADVLSEAARLLDLGERRLSETFKPENV